VSNFTMLVTTESPTKPFHDRRPKGCTLLTAAEAIPVFWYMLFDETCLAMGEVDDESPDHQYAHLTTPTAEGLARAKARRPEVLRILGAEARRLFPHWFRFVKANAKAFLHCETYEWYQLANSHKAHEQELRTCLAAFGQIPSDVRPGSPPNEWWEALLGQAHVRPGSRFNPLGNLSYAGYEGDAGPVPWSLSETDRCGTLR
jgi:hypothetical protein